MPTLLRTLIRLQNPFMKWMLRSPFHGVVSRFYLLITVTGRQSGCQYEIPVQYHQEGKIVWILTSEHYRWWRNLRGGAPVTLTLRGNVYEACATASSEPATVMTTIKRIYPSFASVSDETVQGKVAIEIQLQP